MMLRRAAWPGDRKLQRAIGEQLNRMIGVGLDGFLELGRVNALHLGHCLLEGVFPVVCLRADLASQHHGCGGCGCQKRTDARFHASVLLWSVCCKLRARGASKTAINRAIRATGWSCLTDDGLSSPLHCLGSINLKQ